MTLFSRTEYLDRIQRTKAAMEKKASSCWWCVIRPT